MCDIEWFDVTHVQAYTTVSRASPVDGKALRHHQPADVVIRSAAGGGGFPAGTAVREREMTR